MDNLPAAWPGRLQPGAQPNELSVDGAWSSRWRTRASTAAGPSAAARSGRSSGSVVGQGGVHVRAASVTWQPLFRRPSRRRGLGLGCGRASTVEAGVIIASAGAARWWQSTDRSSRIGSRAQQNACESDEANWRAAHGRPAFFRSLRRPQGARGRRRAAVDAPAVEVEDLELPAASGDFLADVGDRRRTPAADSLRRSGRAAATAA